jgi:hypothetical protein
LAVSRKIGGSASPKTAVPATLTLATRLLQLAQTKNGN